MTTHRTIVALAAGLSVIAAAWPASALAAPTEVNVRVEGQTETLFEGPIRTEGHAVRASSDTSARSCDGINPQDPQNTLPGATPTASAVDAMGMIGETFDGRWEHEDYFVTRWGPDKEAGAMSWGVVVNNVFTNVGGCQYELPEKSELLWAYNAFVPAGKPLLALYPAGDTAAARPLIAEAQLGKPFHVEVLKYANAREGKPPPQPERTGAAPMPGALVAPVKTAANGFERIEPTGGVETDSNGIATLTFGKPGWQRIKATVLNKSKEEVAIRSNRLDVCVPETGQKGCGAVPSEDDVRLPAYLQTGGGSEEHPGQGGGSQQSAGSSLPAGPLSGALSFTASKPAAGPPRIQPGFDGLGTARGLIGVSWQILDAGAGLSAWSISAEALGGRAGYRVIASGRGGSQVLLALAAGRAYELSLTITDALGHSSTTAIGKVLVPFDDRWKGLHYRGRWTRGRLAGAWLSTVSRGRIGAGVQIKMAAGRPVFVLRATSGPAQVEVLSGSRHQAFTIAGGAVGSLRRLVAAGRQAAGNVRLRVLKGTIELDGVGVEA